MCSSDLRTSFVLKGSGWYVTDYARKEKKTGDGDKKIGTSDMVLKEYAKAASNAASSQSTGSTLSLAA